MNQCGSLLTVPKRESVWCMDKVQAGTHVDQQDFYQGNSRARAPQLPYAQTQDTSGLGSSHEMGG